jgi:FkbM family methyltransferase
LGLNKWLASKRRAGYEDRFGADLLARVRTGDIVWDVGANVGFYTKRFAELAGPAGKVIAFEPSPANCEKLRQNTVGLENVVVMPYGLGNNAAKLSFLQGTDELGATSRVVAGTEGGTQVDVRRGDEVAGCALAPGPTLVKIDVEGFEWEVLEGFGGLLERPGLHTLGIELHFGLLVERGMAAVPAQIEALLKRSRFACHWPDSSHLIATRGR